MKNIYLLCAFALTLSITACNEQPKENNTTTIIETKTEAPEKKSTSVKINPEGGSFKTNSVEVEVNK
jgi:hypothetical protein